MEQLGTEQKRETQEEGYRKGGRTDTRMGMMGEVRELSGSSSDRSWKSYKRKSGGGGVVSWSRNVSVMLILLGVSLWGVRWVGASEDWTSLCPKKCKCTWVSGKKQADCQRGGFDEVPVGLSPDVQVLDLSYNKISTLTNNAFKAKGLENLQKVFLKSCHINKIDRDAFRDLKIMIELDLTDNKLESLFMETFDSNERLRELRLKENPMTKLMGIQFPPLQHLKLLDLSNCQLSQLNKKTFDKLTNLEQLDLTGNKFQYISEDVLKPLTKLKSLSLQNNPWKCDCRLKSFRDWAISRKLLQSTTCVEPGHLANFQWTVLQSSDFACKPEIVTLQISGQATEALIVYADVGSDITLECLVRANPSPEVKWVRDGQVLANSSRNQGKIYLLHISGEYERWVNLTILKSDPEDAGEYTCVGNNAGGVVEKNLTLNFQDVPPKRTGVGPSIGEGHGAYRDQSWLWILIGVLGSLVIITMVIMIVCFCTRKRRVKTARAQDLKNEAKLNGSVAGYTECPTQTSKSDVPKQNVITLSSDSGSGCGLNKNVTVGMPVVAMRRGPRLDGYEGLPQTEFELSDLPSMSQHHHPHQHQLPPGFIYPDSGSYVPQERYDETRMLTHGGSIIPIHSFSTPMGPHNVEQQQQLLDGTTPLLEQNYTMSMSMSAEAAGSDYPDLLDIPHRSQDSPVGSSASTVPDSTRLIMPQQLNPAALVTYDTASGRTPITISYGHHSGIGRPHSPYAASISSFTSEPAVIVPPLNRPGYVTLPRRPRVPSWSPASAYVPTTPLSPSPTGSCPPPLIKIGPKYDNLGPRTTADGSSRLSLNKIGDGNGTLTPSSTRSPAVRQSTATPLSHHSPAQHFNFAPIQEHDGPIPSSSSNNGIMEQPLSTLPRSWKPQDVPSETIAPSTPGSHPTPSVKKVPPKPPPKPMKKSNLSEATKSVQTSSQNEGDDGTEV